MHARAEYLGASIRRHSRVPPTAPPSAVAAALRRPCRIDSDAPPTVSGYGAAGRSTFVVRPSGYDAHDEFTIAHELVEQYVPRKLPTELHESFCDRAAAALMLPRDYFTLATWRARFDLATLRQRHWWASWTALAWRLVEVFPGLAAGLWVDGALIERRVQGVRCDAGAAENAAAREAARRGLGLIGGDGWLARGWYVTGKRKPYAVITIAVPFANA